MKKSFGMKRLSFDTVEDYNRIANGNEDFHGFDSFNDLGDEFAHASGPGAIAARSTEPYVLSITNAGGGTETAIIFGRNRFQGQPNFGSGVNITITMGVATVPYEQMLQQSASEPFETTMIRLSSSSTAQLDQNILYVKTDSNGDEAQTTITVTSYISPDQFQNTLRDIPTKLQIDGNTHLSYPILAGQTVTMSIYVAAKVNTSKPLIGKQAVTEYPRARVRTFKN